MSHALPATASTLSLAYTGESLLCYFANEIKNPGSEIHASLVQVDDHRKGKIALDEENYSWYGALAQKWGRGKTPRYMRTLAKQGIQLRRVKR